MSKTVVGLFNSLSEAEQVKQNLVSNGFQSQQITVVAQEGNESDTDMVDESKPGVGHRISEFFSNLTGGDHDVHHHYASGVNSGGGLLAVTCPDEQATDVASMLKQYGARDIDNSYGDEADSGVPVYGGGSAAQNVTGETAIPIVEEELQVGKREVDRGGVRVYSHVIERPVSADVTLRDEHINVQRRAVNRAATAADFAAGSAGTIELNATGEEAVVGKTARVVEEVLVGKSSSERTEAIHDSVRRTEVEVEQVPGTTTSQTGYETGTTTGTKSGY